MPRAPIRNPSPQQSGGDDAALARPLALHPLAEEGGGDAQDEDGDGEDPAELGEAPVAGDRLGDAELSRERQVEDAERVGLPDAEMRRQRAGWDQPPIESGPGDDPLSAKKPGRNPAMVTSRRQGLESGIPSKKMVMFSARDPAFLCPEPVSSGKGGLRGKPSAGREQRAQSSGRQGGDSDAHLAKGVAGAEPPPEEQSPKAGKRDLARGGPLLDLGDGASRRPRDGGQAQLQDAAEPQPEGRLRLPELRLARSRRRAQDRRVLRERRQGGRAARRRARASRRSSSRSIRSPSC